MGKIQRIDNAYQLTDYRRNDVGFVFQFYNLVPNLTALENVELASEIVQDAQDAAEALAAAGLGNRLHNFLLNYLAASNGFLLRVP